MALNLEKDDKGLSDPFLPLSSLTDPPGTT